MLEKLTFKDEATQKFDVDYDHHEGFPRTPADKILPVNMFNCPIISKDVDCDEIVDKIAFEYRNEMIDVRPYMVEYPFSVNVHDSVDKCLQVFMLNHLRHLCVVNPNDGACVGVITRKDLFAYSSL